MFLLLLTIDLVGLVPSESQSLSEVAFSAVLTHHSQVQEGDTVVYDHVFTNYGNAYDNATGEFICPQTGVYVFQFHALSRQGYRLGLALYQDYMRRAAAWAETSGDWAATGNNVILHLTKGDQVRIEGYYISYLYGTPDQAYCTFSGYLISPMHDESPIVG